MAGNLPSFPLHPPPLSVIRMHQQSGGGCIDHCGGRGRVQTRSGSQNYKAERLSHQKTPYSPNHSLLLPLQRQGGRLLRSLETRLVPAGSNHGFIDLTTWELPETPFKRVRAELTNLQNEYWRLEHITRGASMALGNCGPGNILRELAKKTD
jgi:hypothetical protein